MVMKKRNLCCRMQPFSFTAADAQKFRNSRALEASAGRMSRALPSEIGAVHTVDSVLKRSKHTDCLVLLHLAY